MFSRKEFSFEGRSLSQIFSSSIQETIIRDSITAETQGEQKGEGRARFVFPSHPFLTLFAICIRRPGRLTVEK